MIFHFFIVFLCNIQDKQIRVVESDNVVLLDCEYYYSKNNNGHAIEMTKSSFYTIITKDKRHVLLCSTAK